MAELRVIRKTQCGSCGKFFSGLTAFDFHLVGEPSKGTPHCMTAKELQDAGYTTERLLVKSYHDGKPIRTEQDVWYSIEGREQVRKAFGSADEEEEATEEESE